MGKLKTHTFKLGKYHIQQTTGIFGMTDTPVVGTWKSDKHQMMVHEGNSLTALESAIHEALHAEGIPDKYLHDKNGDTDTERIARFIWRLGWRRE